MADRKHEGGGLFGRLTNYVAITVLVLSYGVALWQVGRRQAVEVDPNTVVLRVTHWQLEAGFREALQEIIDAFEVQYEAETGTRVVIEQNPISERVYRQYVQTQCIGRTAPDLIEMGRQEEADVPRYYVPMTQEVQQPNPYNKGTDLEQTPWMDTYFDGMLGSLDSATLEYYGAGSSTYAVRVFYNKELYKEITGDDEPPREYRQFLAVCRQCEKWAREHGREDFTAIAGSRYQVNMFGFIDSGATLELSLKLDQDMDGDFGYSRNSTGDEVFFAYAAGDLDYGDPALRANSEILTNITGFFQPGFMAMDRMEAQFWFTQGKAVFIASGSWDANTYATQADFPVGVIDFPRPAPDDPEYGEFVKGRRSEASNPSVARFGITKFSKHPEVALRFLQFLTSRRNNERFCWRCKWPPVIDGAKPHPLMEKFVPDPSGFWSNSLTTMIGYGPAGMVAGQANWELVEHKIDYDQYVRLLDAGMPRAFAQEFQRLLERDRESRQSLSTSISNQLAAITFADTWPDPVRTPDQVRDRAAEKIAFMWETRSRMFRNAYRVERWHETVATGAPRAREIDSYITGELGDD